MARPLPQIVAGEAPRIALLKEVSARDLTAIFTAVIAEDASLLDGVQAAHPLLRAGFGVERTPFTQLDLLLAGGFPTAYGTGQWFRLYIILPQLHRLADGPDRAGNGLRIWVYFLPFGRASSMAMLSTGAAGICTRSIRVWAVQPVRQSASAKRSIILSLTFILSQICPHLNTLFYFHILLTLLLSCVIMIAQNCSNRNSFQDRRKEKADGRDDAGLSEGNRLHAV